MKNAKLIYQAPGMLAAKSVQLLLESFKIQSQAIQESAGIVYGFTAGVLGGANIYVSEEDEQEALKIIKMMDDGQLTLTDQEILEEADKLSDEELD